MFDASGDYQQATVLLGVKRSTAVGWIDKHQSGEETRKHGGLKNLILKEAEIEQFLTWILNGAAKRLGWLQFEMKVEAVDR